MPDKSTDIESDVIKRYQRRLQHLDNVCLADFAAWFNCVKDSTQFSQEATQSEIPTVSHLPENDFAIMLMMIHLVNRTMKMIHLSSSQREGVLS